MMASMQQRRIIALAAILFVALTVSARDTRKELTIDLRFAPQEGVQSTSPDVTPAALEKSLTLRVEDARGGDATIIGQGTNDDDENFPMRASTEVTGFVAASVKDMATAWGVKVADKGDRVLVLRLMRYFVDESNKALGSVYASEVKFAYELQSADGKKLLEGATSGSAHRYGRARSAENCNEVLSDALKEAFANVLSDPRVQETWASGRGSAGASNAKQGGESSEERLRKLDDLLKKGLITKEEYDRKRAEILKEL